MCSLVHLVTKSFWHPIHYSILFCFILSPQLHVCGQTFMLAWGLLMLLKIHVDSILLLTFKHRMEAICCIQRLSVSYHLNAFSLQRCCRLFKRCEDVSALKFYGNSLVVSYKCLLYFFVCVCVCPMFFIILFLLLVLQLERDQIGAEVSKQHQYF